MRLALLVALVALALPAVLLAAPREEAPAPRATPAPPPQALPPVARRERAPLPAVPDGPPSRAVGQPWAGRLVNGRLLPARGPGYVSWDPILETVPGRAWRRYGTERLVRTVRRVLAAYAADRAGAPPILVGDLSRPRGGNFGPRYGGLGHASHQNGIDVDVYYPRRDGAPIAPERPADVDRAAAQELVDRFLAVGPEFVFVGPSLGLRGPAGVVQPLAHHDDHLHVRLRAPTSGGRRAGRG
jgi:murein endopeptidase